MTRPAPTPRKNERRPRGNPSARQEAVLEAITTLTARQGYAPSLEELAAELGLVKSTVKGHVDGLRAAGRVRFEDGKPRTLRVAA